MSQSILMYAMMLCPNCTHQQIQDMVSSEGDTMDMDSLDKAAQDLMEASLGSSWWDYTMGVILLMLAALGVVVNGYSLVVLNRKKRVHNIP